MVNNALANFFDNLEYLLKRISDLIHRCEKIAVALILLALTIIGGVVILQREFPEGLFFSQPVKAEVAASPSPSPSPALDSRKSIVVKPKVRKHHSIPKVAPEPCACTCPQAVDPITTSNDPEQGKSSAKPGPV